MSRQGTLTDDVVHSSGQVNSLPGKEEFQRAKERLNGEKATTTAQNRTGGQEPRTRSTGESQRPSAQCPSVPGRARQGQSA